MNKYIVKVITALVLTITYLLLPVSAAGVSAEGKNQILISETKMYTDGYSVEISVYEDKNSYGGIVPFATTYEKSGKKTYTAKNNSGEVLFTFVINGTFTVSSHGSALCTKASYSYSIKNASWELSSASAVRSANKAVGDAKFIKKWLSVTVDTIEPHIVLTCDTNGNLS